MRDCSDDNNAIAFAAGSDAAADDDKSDLCL